MCKRTATTTTATSAFTPAVGGGDLILDALANAVPQHRCGPALPQSTMAMPDSPGVRMMVNMFQHFERPDKAQSITRGIPPSLELHIEQRFNPATAVQGARTC